MRRRNSGMNSISRNCRLLIAALATSVPVVVGCQVGVAPSSMGTDLVQGEAQDVAADLDAVNLDDEVVIQEETKAVESRSSAARSEKRLKDGVRLTEDMGAVS